MGGRGERSGGGSIFTGGSGGWDGVFALQYVGTVYTLTYLVLIYWVQPAKLI